MAAGGQRAGVAVGVDAGVVGQQGGAQLAQAQIGGLVVLVNAFRFAGQAAAQGLAFQVGAEPLQALQGPEQIDRGGAAGGQGLQRRAQRLQGRAPAQAQGFQRQAVGGGDADRRGAAYRHVADRAGGAGGVVDRQPLGT